MTDAICSLQVPAQAAEYVRRIQHGLKGRCIRVGDTPEHQRALLATVVSDGSLSLAPLACMSERTLLEFRLRCMGYAIQTVFANPYSAFADPPNHVDLLRPGVLRALHDYVWQQSPDLPTFRHLFCIALEGALERSSTACYWLARQWRLLRDVLPRIQGVLDAAVETLLEQGCSVPDLRLAVSYYGGVEPTPVLGRSAQSFHRDYNRLPMDALRHYKPEYAEVLADLLTHLSRANQLVDITGDDYDRVALDKLAQRIRADAPRAFVPATPKIDYTRVNAEVTGFFDRGCESADESSDDD